MDTDSNFELHDLMEEISADLCAAFEEAKKQTETGEKPAFKEAEYLFRYGLVLAGTIMSYPNKRVSALAVYHRKHKIRKKNLRRIIRWGNKEGYYL